ncbi:MAG: TetR family transcriptional regulator [Campylobacterota bacterium]|nr:TetR family transcriptional regulator [Campylobacterota bacterium]
MKISKKAKAKTKAKIIRSSVDLITQKGFKNASLREIAKNAGVSNPTIYNYFPNKEKLLYGYIEYQHSVTAGILQEIDDFHTYTLREQLQTLIATELELYLEDREFVMQIADMVFVSSSVKLDAIYETKEKFIEIVDEMLRVSIESGEIKEPPFRDYMPMLFWDYYIAVIAYWVEDESDSFENTTQFIDHSMGVIEALLHSDVLSRVSDLGMFLLKTHLLSALQKYTAPQKGLKILKQKLEGLSDG